MTGVLLIAAVMRLSDLHRLPPGLQFDEAYNALDARQVLAGHWSVFFPANGGREPFLTYLQAPLLAITGDEQAMLALRLACAAVGLLTIAATGRCLGQLFTPGVGVLAAGYLAASYWHLHFSRYGIRAILAPLWATLAVAVWWSSVGQPPNERRRATVDEAAPPAGGSMIRRAILLGAILAAWVYSHPTGRLFPLVLLADAALRTARRDAAGRVAWRVLVLAGLTAAVLLLPFAWYFAHHRWLLFAHPSDVSLWTVARERYGGHFIRALADHLLAVAGMFVVRGDPSLLHNLSGLPVFDPLGGLLFLFGSGVLLAWVLGMRHRRPTPNRPSEALAIAGRARMILLWLAIMLLPTVLSDRPPNYSRAMAALPAIVALPALGLSWLSAPWSPARRRWASVAAVALAFAWTGYHYFIVFGQRTPAVHRSYDVPIMDAYGSLAQRAHDAAVFIQPVWGEHATFVFLNRRGPVRVLDASDSWLLPSGARQVLTTFPLGEAKPAEWFKEAGRVYGRAGRRVFLNDRFGQPLLGGYLVPASAAGDMRPPRDAPLEPELWAGARFGRGIELVGYRYGETAPGELVPIVLVWRALAVIERDWTLFVHLRAADGRSLGQADERPANGSYPTWCWQPGDLLIDRAIPRLAADARGQVHVAIGWYDPLTGERLPTGGSTELELAPLVETEQGWVVGR